MGRLNLPMRLPGGLQLTLQDLLRNSAILMNVLLLLTELANRLRPPLRTLLVDLKRLRLLVLEEARRPWLSSRPRSKSCPWNLMVKPDAMLKLRNPSQNKNVDSRNWQLRLMMTARTMRGMLT